ncbi:MAG TPA: signal peptidase II [Actinomycetota bacterium]|jgi:signal peptidase II
MIPGAGRRYALLLSIAAIVVALDQATKQIALASLDDGPVDVIEGVLSLRLTYNSGGAFGLLQGLPGVFLVATLAIVSLILLWVRKIEHKSWIVSLGLVVGGGLGNVGDRMFRDTGGRVVDFVDLHVWPVFNFADAAIVCGVVLMLVVTSLPTTRHSKEEAAASP